MEKIAVSVIMPFYNAAQYLPDTLRSLAWQTVRGFELIAVDDASADDSAELVTAFAEEHLDIPVRLIRGEENVGDCSARNIGLQHARGRYICLIDADDLYAADYVELLLAHIRETGADFVFCGYDKLYNQSGKTIPYEQFKAYPPSARKDTVLRWYLLGRTHIGHWAAMYQRAFLEQNQLRYTDGWHVAGDTEFGCKVLLSCQSVSFLPKSLYFYRIRPGSITTSIPNASAFGSYGAYLRVLHSIRNPFLKLFFLVTKQARATNIILGKFYRANVPMPYLYCSKYKILLYQILNCVISRPKDARILLRYYVDTYLRKAR